MVKAKAKTIKLLLDDGTLKGVISIADSSWNSGELFSSPRDSVNELISTGVCDRYGIYLLLSDDMVYVGQSSDLAKRIKQHIIGKEWWERVIVLTTIDDNFTRSDIDFLESKLIELANKYGRLDVDNKNKGNNPKVDKFRGVELEQYLDEALFLLELIGVTVFKKSKPKQKNNKDTSTLIETIKPEPKNKIEIRAKKEAKNYLAENGVIVNKEFNYAKRQDNKNSFWINARTYLVEQDWDIVLNNQFANEIIYISVPKNTFFISKTKGDKGLKVRKDKTFYIDLNINGETYIDSTSHNDFSPYIKKKIKY